MYFGGPILVLLDLLFMPYVSEREEKKAREVREKKRITGDLQPLSAELTNIFSGILANKKINLNTKPFKPPTPYNPLK